MVPASSLASLGFAPVARRAGPVARRARPMILAARTGEDRAQGPEKWSAEPQNPLVSARGRGLAAGATGAARLLGVLSLWAFGLLGFGGLGGCCLVRPPDAETLVGAGMAGWRTPEAAFETFRVAFGADLPELEYRSFSRDFRRREGVSYQSYRVAREKLLAENPFLPLLSRAEVVESRVVVENRRHRLLVQAAGRRFAVELVREDRFQIYAGTEFLADGPVDFDRAMAFRAAPGGSRAVLDLLVPEDDLAGVDLGRATSFVIEETWKIDRFGEAGAP